MCTITTRGNYLHSNRQSIDASMLKVSGQNFHGTIYSLAQNTQCHDTDLSLCSCPEVGLTSRDTSMLGDVGTSLLIVANIVSMASGSAKLGVPTANTSIMFSPYSMCFKD